MNEKKLGITIGIVIVLLLVMILAFNVGSEEVDSELSQYDPDVQRQILNAQKESAAVDKDEKKDFTEISVDDWYQYKASGGGTLVLAASPTCSYCQVAEPIIQNIMYKNNLDIKYLDVSKFDEETLQKFIDSDELFKDGFGTPILFIIGEGKIIDIVDGLTDTEHYEEFFRNYNLI